MITLMIILLVLCLLFGLGYAITGFALKTVFWVVVKLPLSLICFAFGLVCCCTLILIPLGFALFALGVKILLPGRSRCFA